MTVITFCFVCAPNPLLTKFPFLSVLSVDSQTTPIRCQDVNLYIDSEQQIKLSVPICLTGLNVTT